MTRPPTSPDFLKPRSDQALRESEIVAMRTLSGHIESLVEQMGEMRTDMREVRDKVLQFEAAKLESQISEMKGENTGLIARITALELAKASDTGARTLAQEVRDWMPVICMIGAALLFWFKHS